MRALAVSTPVARPPVASPLLDPGEHSQRQTRPRYRVLAIAPTFFFGDYGCHVRILEEALALRALGSRTVICTYHGGRDAPGVAVARALRLPWCDGGRVGSFRARPFLDGFLLLTALRVGRRFRPHVVHAHLHEGALIGAVLSRLWRVPLVFDFQGSLTSEMVDHGFITAADARYRLLRWVEGVLDRHADVVLTSTRHSAGLLLRDFGCAPELVRPLPDAVNTDVFRPRWSVPEAARLALRRQLGIPPERKLVVYLGLLAEYQGASHLLRAAVRVLEAEPLAHFLLMGYPGQERYRALARSLGIADRCTFTGRLAYEDAPRFLALGDVAVAPKVSQTEGNGKLLNYMALGLPTAAFDTPVNHEILGELGVYAPLGDAAGLAAGMLRLLADPAGAAELGRRLRERAVRDFSWTRAAEGILDVYDALLAGRLGRRPDRGG